ncbi:MAG: 1-acyl-sn-glycerol-3-phosphate acyltransferase [Bacteroidales bacterium]|nr:1-acyl-sn-glycerol-3-phosphate acyltransferase [Bacteroidales bacterium]
MSEYIPIPEARRFDLLKDPIPVKWYLRPIVWLISFPVFWMHRSHIKKIGMENVKNPYILLCSHNAFYDFMVATVATWPHQAYYIVAVDGFIGREWLMRGVGCIGKRKFTNDISIIRHMRKVLDRGKVVAFYPEARYSLCGTNAILPASPK